jgi:hypothetical protein
MIFEVRWLEEKSTMLDGYDIIVAEERAIALMARLGGFPTVRLLSIHPLRGGPTEKPPTPFGKPPGGTLGGGQVSTGEFVRAA